MTGLPRRQLLQLTAVSALSWLAGTRWSRDEPGKRMQRVVPCVSAGTSGTVVWQKLRLWA